jgi:hypothetical protein
MPTSKHVSPLCGLMLESDCVMINFLQWWQHDQEKRGNLGMLLVDSHGHVESTATHDMLMVADVIGRSVVLYGVSEEGHITRVAAAVIARSARPSSLNPQLCNCDGSILWQGTTTS